MIVQLLEKIENPVWKGFAFRVYNTFTSVILPAILPLILLELTKEENYGSIACLFDSKFLNMMLYVVVVTLVGSILAGVQKASRVLKEEKEIILDASDEG